MGTTVTIWTPKEPAFSSIAGFSSDFDIGGPLLRPLGRFKSAPPVVLNPGNRVVLNSGNQAVLNRGNWVGPNWGNSALGDEINKKLGLHYARATPNLLDVV